MILMAKASVECSRADPWLVIAAKRWKRDAESAVERGELRAPTATTVREVAKAFMAGAKDGSIPTASGGQHKPATLRGYRVGLDKRVQPFPAPSGSPMCGVRTCRNWSTG